MLSFVLKDAFSDIIMLLTFEFNMFTNLMSLKAVTLIAYSETRDHVR